MYDSFDNTYQVGATAGIDSQRFVCNDRYYLYWSVTLCCVSIHWSETYSCTQIEDQRNMIIKKMNSPEMLICVCVCVC